MPHRADVTIVDVTPETVASHGLCGYKDASSLALRRKTEWFRRRFDEGMRIKVLRSAVDGAVGSIEYVPGEYAWRGLRAAGYMVIHCVFVLKRAYKGRGLGSRLIRACEEDAAGRGMHGVAVVTSKSTWMAKRDVFLKRGYEVVEEAPPHYQLLVKRFSESAPLPGFQGDREARLAAFGEGLTIVHSAQCPYVVKAMGEIPSVAREEFGIEPTVVELPGCREAQASPNPYGVFSVIWNGELVADHPISKTRFRNIMRNALC